MPAIPLKILMSRHGNWSHPLSVAALCLSLGSMLGCAGDRESDNDCINGKLAIECSGRLELSEAVTGMLRSHGDLVQVGGGGLALGESLQLRFLLRNTAAVASSAPLRISAVKLEEEPMAGASAAAFSCWNADLSSTCGAFDGRWRTIVPAGVTLAGAVTAEEVVIRYTRVDNAVRGARLLIAVSGDSGLANGTLLLRLVGGQGAARLKLVPELLSFGPLSAGSDESRTVELVNSGDADLLIHQLKLSAPAAFSIQTSSASGEQLGRGAAAADALPLQPPLVISPGGRHAVQVTFVAADDKPKQGTLTVTSNDPTPGGGVAQLTANASVPCIKVTPHGGLDFGSLKVGDLSVRQVVLRNCGGSKLLIHRIDLGEDTSGDEFDLLFAATHKDWPAVSAATGPTDSAPLSLGPNQQARFEVRYQPSAVSAIDPMTQLPDPDIAEVRVFSNALQKSRQHHLPRVWGCAGLPGGQDQRGRRRRGDSADHAAPRGG